MKIYKYMLDVTDIQEIELPLGSKVLTVQVQNNGPCLWCLVHPKIGNITRTIRTIGTGNPIDEDFKGEYIGTYQMLNGRLVWHIFFDDIYSRRDK